MIPDAPPYPISMIASPMECQALSIGLWKIGEQFLRWHGQCLCQLHDIFQSHVPLAAFHPADIISMQVCPLGQLFLRIATLLAKPA